MDQVFNTVQSLPAFVIRSFSFQSLCLVFFYRWDPLVLLAFAALHSFFAVTSIVFAVATQDGGHDRHSDRQKRS
jgi:hypothetical protein